MVAESRLRHCAVALGEAIQREQMRRFTFSVRRKNVRQCDCGKEKRFSIRNRRAASKLGCGLLLLSMARLSLFLLSQHLHEVVDDGRRAGPPAPASMLRCRGGRPSGATPARRRRRGRGRKRERGGEELAVCRACRCRGCPRSDDQPRVAIEARRRRPPGGRSQQREAVPSQSPIASPARRSPRCPRSCAERRSCDAGRARAVFADLRGALRATCGGRHARGDGGSTPREAAWHPRPAQTRRPQARGRRARAGRGCVAELAAAVAPSEQPATSTSGGRQRARTLRRRRGSDLGRA